MWPDRVTQPVGVSQEAAVKIGQIKEQRQAEKNPAAAYSSIRRPCSTIGAGGLNARFAVKTIEIAKLAAHSLSVA
jgi:hypothetical protein